MNETQAERQKRTAKRRYDKIVAQARAEYEKFVESIDFILHHQPSGQRPKRKRHRDPDLASKVEEVGPTLPQPFTVGQLEDRLRTRPGVNGNLNRNSLGNILKAMKGDKVRLVEEGKGPRPARWEWLNATTTEPL